jgi:hypothetical protein
VKAVYWPRRDCRQCGAKNLLVFVLDNDDLCPTCSSIARGAEPVTEFWPCPKCGTRMWTERGGGRSGGGLRGCCWLLPYRDEVQS